MAFDLATMMFKKQERECARLAEHEFSCRARRLRRIAEWVAAHADAPIDGRDTAARLVMEKDEVIVADLRRHLRQPVPDRDWNRLVAALSSLAEAELRIERGDPSPVPLA